MEHKSLGAKPDFEAELHSRRRQLIVVCDELAKDDWQVRVNHDGSSGDVTIWKGHIEVTIGRPRFAHDSRRRNYGQLSVVRKWIDDSKGDSPYVNYAGLAFSRTRARLDSFICWTGFEESQDVNWYVGETGDKGQVLDAGMIRGWLNYAGPSPIS